MTSAPRGSRTGPRVVSAAEVRSNMCSAPPAKTMPVLVVPSDRMSMAAPTGSRIENAARGACTPSLGGFCTFSMLVAVSAVSSMVAVAPVMLLV